MPIRDRPTDACPGALRVHAAADGGVARIRVPGGRLTATQFRAVRAAAPDGTVELTSRANLQIRGLAEGCAPGERLAAAGLLPSATHELVRNIIASPLSGDSELVRELDAGLCARPALAGLPGRFLFIVDSGDGDVAWLDGDVTALFRTSDTAAVLLGGVDVGLRAGRAELVRTMLDCAERFLAVRTGEWRIAELPDLTGFRAMSGRVEPVPAGAPPARGPVGRFDRGDGLVSLGVSVPLGRVDPAQGAALEAAGPELVITPWRGVVVPDVPADRVDAVAARLAATGLLLDPDAPAVTACTGRPGCAKALADVRADAAAMLRAGPGTTVAVHWSGCARRCGRPRGDVLDVVATGDGYVVRRELR
ncbi:MAG TPA: precorrin-3B synthase [Actinophytocola sp.]|uniref:precorrin-3B synthase n=1 Tax=Actinophytocola sp. TaxID=1872138 RepID=UPI002DB66421|nr:precorrin-3B synthase [Actinophytocola sp.]HEU5470560.1 precorrin-3B synthase [Actinophytocola sp.]